MQVVFLGAAQHIPVVNSMIRHGLHSITLLHCVWHTALHYTHHYVVDLVKRSYMSVAVGDLFVVFVDMVADGFGSASLKIASNQI